MTSEKQKILVVTRDISYVGGTEKFIEEYILYLAYNKKPIIYLYETDGHNAFDNPKIYEKLIKSGIKIYKSKNPCNNFWNPENAHHLSEIIKIEKINIVHTFLFNPDFTIYSIINGLSNTRHLLQTQYKDLNLSPNQKNNMLNLKKLPQTQKNFTWVSSKLCDFSVALEENTPLWKLRKKIIDNELELLVSSQTDIIHVVSKKAQQKWLQMNKNVRLSPCCSIGKKDIIQINNTIQKTTSTPQKGLIFCTISRLVEEKGLGLLIKSFQTHNKSHPDDKLIIGGTGPLEKKLKKLAKNSKNINFIGKLTRSQVINTLSNSHVFVLLSESEGFPLTIQEAMACSLPILATNVGGILDLVQPNCGKLIKPNDKEMVIKKLSWYSNPQNRKKIIKMGKESKKRIHKYYLKENVIEKIFFSYFCNISNPQNE